MLNFIQSFDHMLFSLINVKGQSYVLDIIFPVLSNFGFFKLPLALFCVVVFIKGSPRFRKNILIIIAVVLVSDFISSRVLKNLFHRLRPCHVIDNVRILGRCSASFSFPSSHAVNISAFACAASHLYPGFKWVLCLLAFAVCYSRVYLGMHYPLDCIVGSIVGITTAVFSLKILSRCLERLLPFKVTELDEGSVEEPNGIEACEH